MHFKQCVVFLSLLTDRDCYHKILVKHPLKIGRWALVRSESEAVEGVHVRVGPCLIQPLNSGWPSLAELVERANV